MSIIGIVGPLACGKGVVADFLIQNEGYSSFSLSTLVHEEAKKRGFTTITRSLLQDIGNDMRKNEGQDVLARRAIKILHPTPSTLHPNIIIEGIRNPGEVEYLKSIPGFILIAVHADQRIRFTRVLSRAKPWDPTNWELFLQVDQRDSGEKGIAVGQQVESCMNMADVHIENNGTVEEVQQIIEQRLRFLR